MTADTPRTRTPFRPAWAAGLAALIALAGCKSKDGGGGWLLGNSRDDKPDPLKYGAMARIPPQNVPVQPDRGAVGAKGKGDPLTNPVGKAGDRGAGYSDDPERFKGVFIPGVGSTPAALAGKGKDDELKIDTPDHRVPLRPAGGGVEPAGNVEAVGDGLEPLYAELERYGARREDRKLGRGDGGRYEFSASVPHNGARRQYSGVGDTPAEAVRQVLDQVAAERK